MSSKVRQEGTSDQDRVISETPVATRSARFAAQFEEVNDDMIALVKGCGDEGWRRICPSEGWTMGVVSHHVASGLPAFHDFVRKLSIADPLTPRVSPDVVNESNAKHARAFADVGKTEVLDLLTTHGPRMIRLLQNLNEEQLEQTTTAFGGREFSLAQLVEMVVVGHSRMHLSSMRAALDD
ncbi:MAG: DinB family protein [Nitrolancea sp.]